MLGRVGVGAVLAGTVLVGCGAATARTQALQGAGYGVQALADAGWYRITEPGGEWSIALPGIPEPVETGDDRVDQLVLAMEGNSRGYQLLVQDFGTLPPEDGAELLAQAREQVVATSAGRLVSEQPAERAGLRGSELVLEGVTGHGHEEIVWLLVSGRHLVTVSFTYLPGTGGGQRAEAGRVVDSLTLR